MIYKRGGIYWYKFVWQKKPVRESTKQGNDKVARQIEAAHKTALAKGEVGIRERKPVPTLAGFISKQFEPWARASFRPKTWHDYIRVGLDAIRGYVPLANLTLDTLTSQHVTAFAAYRLQGRKVSTVNRSLEVLRRVLGMAVEWGVLQSALKIKKLPGEHHREHVVTLAEEAKYLSAASEPLVSVASVLIDSGLRPEECFRLRWESITWSNGRYGTLFIAEGKTKAARRVLPMTPRVRKILEARWEGAGKPVEGWIWPALTRSQHLESSSIKKQHAKAITASKVRPFVLYSLRHTFLTRLGESGCDVWTLARIAGHSSVEVSSRYVHPGNDTVLTALERLGGHNSGHSDDQAQPIKATSPLATQ